jgi:G3E family GTPase
MLSLSTEPSERQGGRRGITLLSGFLGSGKTTLLRAALDPPASGTKPMVVLNDIAASFADGRFLTDARQDVVVVSGGCVCCTRRDVLVDVLKSDLDHVPAGSPDVRHVIIETSGLSDPGPIAFAVATDPVLRHHYALVHTCVALDVLDGLRMLEQQEVARRQLMAADEVIVTKADLADARVVDAVCARAHTLNPSAAITVTALGRRVRQIPAKTSPAVREPAADSRPHLHGIATVEFAADVPLDWQAFSVWLSLLVHRHGAKVLRVKGALEVEGVGHVSINAVRDVVYPPEHLAPSAEPGSRFVCIVQGIAPDVLRRSFSTLVAAK